MMDLYHELDYCAYNLKKAAEKHNATVRKRIQKRYFTMNGHTYTVFGYNWTGADAGAFIGVREDFLKWVTKKCKEAK